MRNSKFDELVDWFEDKEKVIVALSGGVDSALVAYAAFQKLHESAIAVTADYKTLSKDELESSKQVCREIGIKQIFLDYSELENKKYLDCCRLKAFLRNASKYRSLLKVYFGVWHKAD